MIWIEKLKNCGDQRFLSLKNLQDFKTLKFYNP